jgi:hypothetical protein
LVFAGVAGYWFLQPHPRIDAETLQKIQVGMTEREVIDIIGAPPGNYGFGEGEVEPIFTDWIMWDTNDPELRTPRGPVQLSDSRTWLGQESGIEVFFDIDGKVASKSQRTVWRPYESHYDKICQMLRLKGPKQRLYPSQIIL